MKLEDILMTIIHPIDTIISDPEIQDGQPMVADRHIRVIDIVASHLFRGLTATEVATNFKLNLGQVYAALAYYYQHKPELDETMRSNAEQAEIYLRQLEEQGKLIRRE
jgi:uncharacterized protein (DUF433 family)